MWDPAAEAEVAIGVAEEVDDLAQLLLRFLDPGDVGEGHLVARGLVPARARAPERAEDVLHAACTPEQPEQQEDEQDRRPEAEQERLPPRCAGIERLGVDDDVVLLQQLRQLVGIGERGDLRSESSRRLRVLERRLFLERALDVRPFGRDLVDVAHSHLLQEERAVRDALTGLRPHDAAGEEEVAREQNDEEDDPARARPVPRATGSVGDESCGAGGGVSFAGSSAGGTALRYSCMTELSHSRGAPRSPGLRMWPKPPLVHSGR